MSELYPNQRTRQAVFLFPPIHQFIMLISEFDYYLPQERIAQFPAQPRDNARLLHLQISASSSPTISHHIVRDLPSLLRPDDLLVVNDTRVLRARLHGHKDTGAKIEALLLREEERNLWEVLLRPSARLKIGSKIIFQTPQFPIYASPEKRLNNTWLLRFSAAYKEAESTFNIRNFLKDIGEVPLPPYIHTQPDDPERYQTIYAKNHPESTAALDSAAAPTAGLHFTPNLMDNLQKHGVQITPITLGVGLGTFLPVKSDTLEAHHMHREEYDIPESTARAIRSQKETGKRVIAVGTTVARTLEAASQISQNGLPQSGPNATNIFIYPPYKFRCVDAMITNFHLPKSTLLAMVSSLADTLHHPESSSNGIEIMQRTYKIAVEEKYRFFSFGDAMFIE